MLTRELHHLRRSARRLLQTADRCCTAREIARDLFGPRLQEDPVAQLLVRSILQDEPRVLRAHDGRWLLLDTPFLARDLREGRYVVVDLETTGSLIGVDHIIEVGVAVLVGGRVVERFGSLVRTDRTLPGRIRRLTGIRASELQVAPDLEEIAPQILALLKDADAFVAHDVRFDLNFLRWELQRVGFDMPDLTGLCTLRLAQQLWPHFDGWRLQDLAAYFDIAHDRPHRAAEDAIATAGVLSFALAAAMEHGATNLADLYDLRALIDRGDEDDRELAARAAG